MCYITLSLIHIRLSLIHITLSLIHIMQPTEILALPFNALLGAMYRSVIPQTLSAFFYCTVLNAYTNSFFHSLRILSYDTPKASSKSISPYKSAIYCFFLQFTVSPRFLNTLRTRDADLRFYVTTLQDG